MGSILRLLAEFSYDLAREALQNSKAPGVHACVKCGALL
jgi:hypothetical protein